MLEKIPFKSAVTTMSILLILVVVFHLLIFTQMIPYDIVWGGKIQNVIQMRRFEAVSIFINALLLSVILIKGKRIECNLPSSVINITLWLFVLLFSVNTVGNLFSNTSTETILFTPLTFISAILCYRIAMEKNKLKDCERQDGMYALKKEKTRIHQPYSQSATITVEKLLTLEVEKQNTPAVQYLFFNADSVLYKFSGGFADIRNAKKANDKTTYHAFSVTKTFTALATLQLAEQGKLGVNEAVNKYLPEFPYSSEITIKQLLNHSAGIPNPMPLNWIHLVNEHDSFGRNDFFKSIFIKSNRARSNPNERFAYSNLGYVILGQVIEKISGISYEQYIHENVLKKLKLQPEDLGFTITSISQNARGYHKKLSFSNFVLGFFIDKTKYMGATEGKWKAFKDFCVNGPPYGGLIGTPLAFAKYVQELLKKDSNLLSNEYKRTLFTENFTNSGKATGMCLSWFKGELNGKQYFAHAGGGGGYYCEIRIYPEPGLGSVIMFNRTGMTDERFLDKVDKYFLRK